MRSYKLNCSIADYEEKIHSIEVPHNGTDDLLEAFNLRKQLSLNCDFQAFEVVLDGPIDRVVVDENDNKSIYSVWFVGGGQVEFDITDESLQMVDSYKCHVWIGRSRIVFSPFYDGQGSFRDDWRNDPDQAVNSKHLLLKVLEKAGKQQANDNEAPLEEAS